MRYYYLGTLERGTATEDMGERIYPEKAPEHPAQLQYHSIWFSHLSTYFTSGWQPTPVFLPGESHGQRSLVGYNPWDRKESDMTEATQHACIHTVVLQDFSARAVWPQSTAFAPSTASLFCLMAICILLGLPGLLCGRQGSSPDDK